MSESIYNNAVDLSEVPFQDWRRLYIGRGYRAACYTVDHERRGRIILLGYDIQGNPKTFICPHRSWIKFAVKYPTGEKDIKDRNIATKYFDTASARRKYLDAAGDGITVVEALRPEQEFLQRLFSDCVLDEDFNRQTMRIHTLDIETEISGAFMSPSEAGNRINMITVHDSKTDRYYTWSLQPAEIDFKEEPLVHMSKDRFTIFQFGDDEDRMLLHFLDWYEENCPDVVSGWNIKNYDIPYMYTRIAKQLGKNQANRLSPVGRCYVKEINHANARADVSAEIEVIIDGVFQADGLILYRDKFKVAGSSIDGGYSLDNIGEHEELGHKIKYEGSLQDLYMKDWQRFTEYNIRDVDLCRRIIDKRKLISQARQIAGYGLCNYDTIYSSISYLIGSIISFSKMRLEGKTFISYLKDRQDFGEGFEGAFVFPCKPHIYRNGEGVIDFASLYPSIIRCLNISPETYVGKVLVYMKDATGTVSVDQTHAPMLDLYGKGPSNLNTGDERIMPVLNAGDPNIVKLELKLPGMKDRRKTITVEQLRKLVKERCVWTPNNTLFLKHEIKNGVVAKWCEYFYGLRKQVKKQMMKNVHVIQHSELFDRLSDEEKERIKTDAENQEVMQLGIKCMINSVYGLCGTGFSPIADPHIAQTITRMGRAANTRTAQYIKHRFIEKYGAPEDYNVACGGDTDSIFINLECVTSQMKREFGLPDKIRAWSQEYRDKLWKDMSEFVNTDVNMFVRNFAHEYCGSNNQNVLTYELEYMSDTILIEGKKHYATRKLYNEGDPVDKIKVSGIELKKGNVPKNIKEFLWDCYRGVIVNDWTEREYREYINGLYAKFRGFSIDQISFWKGYNTEREASGFLQMAQSVNAATGKTIGTTGISKSCCYYNQIIEKLGIQKKYPTLRIGDKVRQCYIDPSNKYSIDTIAYKDGQWPSEFDQMFKPDYRKMFEKLIQDPLKRFREACGFQNVDPTKQVQFDIFEL